jgi:hypothetical protein
MSGLNNIDFFCEVGEEKRPKMTIMTIMTIMEFIQNTRFVLEKISDEYAKAHIHRTLNDSDREHITCDDGDNCTESFEINGNTVTCRQDYEAGECIITEYDHASFSNELENIMFYDDKYKFFDLLTCEIFETLKPPSEAGM